VEVWPDALHEMRRMSDENQRRRLHDSLSDVMWLYKICTIAYRLLSVLQALVQACSDAICSKDAYGLLPIMCAWNANEMRRNTK